MMSIIVGVAGFLAGVIFLTIVKSFQNKRARDITQIVYKVRRLISARGEITDMPVWIGDIIDGLTDEERCILICEATPEELAAVSRKGITSRELISEVTIKVLVRLGALNTNNDSRKNLSMQT